MSDSTDDFELCDCQVEEIKKGLAEAHAGNFATDEEMATVIEKWTQGKGVYGRA